MSETSKQDIMNALAQHSKNLPECESLQQLETVIQNHTTATEEVAAAHAVPSSAPTWAGYFIEAAYLLATILFILGLKKMSSPVTARNGIVWAGVGMVVATLVTFLYPGMSNYMLMLIAIALGSVIAWWTAQRVAMTDMPQMIAVYNGLGGGAAAAIAAVELIKGVEHGGMVQTLAVFGALIGSVAFSGSVIAFAKLDGRIKKTWRFDKQQLVNLGVFAATLLLGLIIIVQGASTYSIIILLFFVLALVFGVMMALPIGGADMPVVISLFNALTGLAVGFEGFVIGSAAMIVAGTVVGSAGTLLTQLMAKAMNRPISNILFSSFGQDSGSASTEEVGGTMKEVDANDAAVTMAFANKVIIIPGYGMAVAQAQHKIWELTKALQERDVEVKFAIHPVAGRMPGHMNVLLAEAGVPYDIIFDLEEINAEFAQADVALIIGANDVVNPVARTDPNSPIYGMPILNADKAQNVFVIKRGRGAGFSGVENALFFADNTRMVFGDGQKVANALLQGVKALSD